MSILDVFNQDAFTYVSLSASVDRMGYVPGYLTAMPGLITPQPIRTVEVWIEERDFMPALVLTTPRGAPPEQVGGDRRKASSFQTTRLAQGSKIMASELLGIREMGSEQQMKTVGGEVGRRNMKIKQNFALTKENMVLGCVQGVVLDADGSVISDWGGNLKQTIPAEVAWNLTSDDDDHIRTQCSNTRRFMARQLRGIGGVGWHVGAICGDEWYDEMTSSTEVRTTYQAQQAIKLQNEVGVPWESFRFGGITFHNYRGSDDGVVSVPTDKVKFFPVGAGTIIRVDAPGESFEDVGTFGQESYSRVVPDLKRDQYAEVEQYSYPLFVNTMPQACPSGGM